MVFVIVAYFFIKRRWIADDEETRQVLYYVDKIIGMFVKKVFRKFYNLNLNCYDTDVLVVKIFINPVRTIYLVRVWR